MELFKMIQGFQQNIIKYNSNGILEGCVPLKPLDCYLPNGLNRKACIHIVGDEEVGKTSLALEFAYRNPDYIFIYVDTYFKIKEEDVPDNVYLFRSNSIEEIIAYLNTLEKKSADYIIIDSISNLVLPVEQNNGYSQYISQRYKYFNTAIIGIINLCCNLNICLILFNTINGNGRASNCSTQILFQCSMSVTILNKVQEGNYYWLNLRADKWPTRTREDSNSSILLTGQGGE